jgi:predicted negative regulator of RcsB-dependent stress response
MILLNQKKYAEARAAYEEALAVNPTLERAQEALDEIDRLEQGI